MTDEAAAPAPAPDEVVYEPGQRPPTLVAYARGVLGWRELTLALARSDLRAQHYGTVFGQAWNVLNPLLLAAVYLVLLAVVSDDRTRTHTAALIAGVFFFQLLRNGLGTGASALVRGERLVLNATFPRAVLPVSSVLGALLLFLPTLGVYVAIHVGLGQPVTYRLAWLLPLAALLGAMTLGLTLLYSALTVEVRDAASFLTHLLRYWFYLTPILFLTAQIPDGARPWLMANPLYPVFAGLQRVVAGAAPTAGQLAAAGAWAAAAVLVGLRYFVARDRHVAVRL